jgi:hypothetical protein
MLPNPKKVAKAINKALFQSEDEKRAEREIDRDVQLRTGKARIRRHINHQNEMVGQLTALAKRALALNDEPRFRQVGRQLLWTKQDIQRWEKYLLSLEILQARRDQVKASVDLIQSVKSMSESLIDLAGPQNVAELQQDLEQGLARAASLEERLDVMMDMMDETLSGDLRVDEDALSNLETNLSEQVAAQETAKYDREIEDGLRQIRQELEKQEK